MTGTPHDALVETVGALATAHGPSDADLLERFRLIGHAQRLLDAIAADAAAQVADRCPPDETSLARRMGARSATELIAQQARVDGSTSSAWLAAGAATATRMTLQGQPLPPKHDPVARAMSAGGVGAATAREIVQTVTACNAGESDDLEALLVANAATLAPRMFSRLCREVIARYAPEDAVERENALRARAGAREIQLPDGITRWILDADPESAGFIKTAIDAFTAPRRVRFRDAQGGRAGMSAPRPLPALRLDAFVAMARLAIASDDGKLAGRSVSLVVTMSLENLMSGLGAAWIEGIDEPISAATARRLAADAEIIPAVLGSRSEPLDLGVTVRLFSEAQRRAIALRDGGCIYPDCTAPPGWCEVAHLLAAALGGPADFWNGVLLCVPHHHLFDEDGWSLEWRGGVPWFIPPAHVDASRTAIRGGRPTLAA